MAAKLRSENSSESLSFAFLKVAVMGPIVAFRSVIDHAQKLIRIELSANLA
jgi:hypothetical protein